MIKMNNLIKKILCIALTSAISVSALSGCGAGNKAEETGKESGQKASVQVESNIDTTSTDANADADVKTDADTDAKTNNDTDANVDVKIDVDVEPVAEPAKVIYEGLTPGGTGYYEMADHDTFHTIGLFNYYVPVDKSDHAAFIAYVGDAIKDGGDYYAARWSSFDEVDIQLYTYSIENCKYAVYFEAPSDFFTGLSYTSNEAIGGCDIRAINNVMPNAPNAGLIKIRAFSIDVANKYLNEWKDFDNSKDIVATWTSTDGFKEYSFEKEDGKIVFLASYEINNKRVFYYDFISKDESLFINDYTVSINVPLDFSEEDALAIINSVRFMEKDEADELYISLLHQTEANENFDPATIE